MKTLLAAALLLGPLVASAQVVSTTPPADQPPLPQPQGVPPPPPATPPPPSATVPQEQVAPPEYGAPPPATDPYAAPPLPNTVEVVPPAPPASGQWVYTAQYGWVWMPYGAAYTYAPAAGAYPDMYVFVPARGWRWVVAPWVWGLGPRPYFGLYGWARFPWYGRGFGHWYGFRRGPAWTGRGWYRPGWYGPGGHPAYPGGFARPRFGRPGGWHVGGFGHR
jgi:hypothetical protein